MDKSIESSCSFIEVTLKNVKCKVQKQIRVILQLDKKVFLLNPNVPVQIPITCLDDANLTAQDQKNNEKLGIDKVRLFALMAFYDENTIKTCKSFSFTFKSKLKDCEFSLLVVYKLNDSLRGDIIKQKTQKTQSSFFEFFKLFFCKCCSDDRNSECSLVDSRNQSINNFK